MRILLIEDDIDLRETLRSQLEAECFAVDTAEDAEQGSFLGRTNEYDVILLDNMLPKGSGRQVCEEIRKSGKSTHIIMLSVQADTSTKVDLLNLGADDYLGKPYSFQELLARIRAVLRHNPTLEPDVLSYEDLRLDVQSNMVRRGQREIYLTRKEFMLLECLLRRQGTIVTRAMLSENVWDSSLDSFSNTIESHILSLRRKIEQKNRSRLILTVPGRGYRIGAPIF